MAEVAGEAKEPLLNSDHLEQQQQQRQQQHDGQYADGGDGEVAGSMVVPRPPRLHHHTAAVPPPAPLSKGSHAHSAAEGDDGGPSPLLTLQPTPLPPVTLMQLLADSRKQLSLAWPLVLGLLVQVGSCRRHGLMFRGGYNHVVRLIPEHEQLGPLYTRS